MEEKVERILGIVLRVQSSMTSKANKDDINDAIAQIRREIGNNSDKVLSN